MNKKILPILVLLLTLSLLIDTTMSNMYTELNDINPYNVITNQINIHSSGNSSNIDNVTLYYRFSTDNTTWNYPNLNITATHANTTNHSFDPVNLYLDYPQRGFIYDNGSAIIFAIVSYQEDAIQLFNVTNPGHPVRLGSLSSIDINGAHDVYVVQYSNGTIVAFVIGYSPPYKLCAYNITNPNAIVKMGNDLAGAGAPNYLTNGGYLDFDETNMILYYTSLGDDSVGAVNITYPGSMNLITAINGTSAHINTAWYPKIVGDYLLVSSEIAPFKQTNVYNITNRSQIIYMKNYTGFFREMQIEGDFMYSLNDTPGSICAFNITDMDNWDKVMEKNMRVYGSLAIDGDYAFCRNYIAGASDRGFRIIDFSNRSNPVNLTNLTVSSTNTGKIGGYLAGTHFIQVHRNPYTSKDVIYCLGYTSDNFACFNITFNHWYKWLDTSNPDIYPPTWDWVFNFPNSTGYYEFYSMGNSSTGMDIYGFPRVAEAICYYENIRPCLNLVSQRSLIEIAGNYGLGNYTTYINSSVYSPVGTTITALYHRFRNETGVLINNVTSGYTQVQYNATHKNISLLYNPSSSIITNITSVDVDVYSYITNSGVDVLRKNITFFDVFSIYELDEPYNIVAFYNTTLNSLNITWDTENHEDTMFIETIFRPNAPGSLTQMTPAGAATNWECVDDVVADDHTTYVSNANLGAYRYDLYNLPDHTTENGSINSITVYARMVSSSSACTLRKVRLTLCNTTDYPGTFTQSIEYDFSHPYYMNIGNTWSTNPDTGVAWTWGDIDNLEIGLGCYVNVFGDARCTQAWVVVNQTVTNIFSSRNCSDWTRIYRRNDTYPSSPVDTNAYLVYNGSLDYWNDTSVLTTRYYMIYNYNRTTESYSIGVPIPWGCILLNVYNESNPSQRIHFDLEISNHNGTIVYTDTNAFSPYFISVSDIPYGDDTYFLISNSTYRSRSRTEDILLNNFYNMSFYLPPIEIPGGGGSGTEGENYTRPYRVKVVNAMYPGDEVPVSDVRVEIKKYINTTGVYEIVATDYTNTNGIIDVWLQPSKHYKVFCTKIGWELEIVEWYTDPIFYGANYPFIIGLNINASGDAVWDYVTYTLRPTVYDQYNNFTVWFNISAHTISMEWYSMNIYQYNDTDNTWFLLETNNETGIVGGSISYEFTSAGKYGVQCGFHLYDFDSHMIGSPTLYTNMLLTVYTYWNATPPPIDFDTIISDVAGDNPVFVGTTVASYIALFASGVVTFILFTMSPKFAGFGVLVIGLILGFMKDPLHLISNTLLNYSVVGIICIIGILMLLYFRKQPNETEGG